MNNSALVVDPKPIYYKKPNFNSCLVCLKSSKKGFDISLHAFPKNKARRAIWLEKCGLVEEDIKHNRKLCCSHFKKDCIKTTGIRIILKKNAVPVIFEKEIKTLGKTEAIFDGLENSAGDIKPLESLFQFTEESSENSLNGLFGDVLWNSPFSYFPLNN